MNRGGHQEDDRQKAGSSRTARPKIEAKLMQETTVKRLNFKELYDGMKCVMCERIPSPYFRYLCPNGHHLCGECGEKQWLTCNQRCPGNKKKVDDEMTAGASGGVKASGSGNCEEEIKRYPSDPLYTALYLHATWICPNAVDSTDTDGCQEVVKGEDLAEHLASGVCQPPDPNLFED